MAWPLTNLRTYIAGTTPTIKASDLNSIQTSIVDLFTGNKTVKSLSVDGTGAAASTAVSGTVRVSATVSGTGATTVAVGDIYKDTTAVAWGVVQYTGATTVALTRGANVASVTRNAAGKISVLLSTSAANILAPSIGLIAASYTTWRLEPANLGNVSFQIVLADNAGTPIDLAVSDGFSFVCFGG